MLHQPLLQQKIADPHFQTLIQQYSQNFSSSEMILLNEIITKFEFDSFQSQALAQAVLQQSRFDPNAQHIDSLFDDEDEETTAICQHCLNPPIPPLRDYDLWREKQIQAAWKFFCCRRQKPILFF